MRRVLLWSFRFDKMISFMDVLVVFSLTHSPLSICFQSGEIDIVNHETGDRCHLKFAPYSYFSRDVARKVSPWRGLKRAFHTAASV